MDKITRFSLLFTLIFSLSGCDIWDDLVDSISGSGDDKSDPIIETIAAKKEAEAEPEEEPEEEKQVEKQESTEYATRFHHTTTGGVDGGKSLVLCPGQRMNYSDCSVGSTSIPFHGFDEGREIYWNMKRVPSGDIVCTKNGKSYRYRANGTFVSGQCN
jgi:hypothetical protein